MPGETMIDLQNIYAMKETLERFLCTVDELHPQLASYRFADLHLVNPAEAWTTLEKAPQ